MKFKLVQGCDFVSGHLRYGYVEGIFEADSPEELMKKYKEDKDSFLDNMELVITDFEVDDYGLDNDNIEIRLMED